MQAQLSAAGIKFRVGASEEAEERRVLEVLKLNDPGGNPIEILPWARGSFQQAVPSGPPHAWALQDRRGRTRPLHHRRKRPRCGAAFLYAVGNARRSRVQDQKWGKRVLELVFMHCNERDHSVAFGVGGPDKRLNHVMIEVDNLDDVGLTYDLVRKNNVPVTIKPGKHSNDHMYSFYFRNPSGWMFEYGWGARAATINRNTFPKTSMGISLKTADST